MMQYLKYLDVYDGKAFKVLQIKVVILAWITEYRLNAVANKNPQVTVTTQQERMFWSCELHLAVDEAGVSSMWSLNACSSVCRLPKTCRFNTELVKLSSPVEWQRETECCVDRFDELSL